MPRTNVWPPHCKHCWRATIRWAGNFAFVIPRHHIRQTNFLLPISSVGHALNIAAHLGTHGSAITKWIEGTIAQADEVDGKLLQFEGGLSITALIINGALKLAASTKSAAPLNEEQANKFVAYFLSRKSVQQPKGASVLVEVLRTIAADRQLAPICIQLIGNGQLQPESPIVSVKIVDVLGNPLTPAISSVSATVTSKSDNSVLVSKSTLSAKSSDKTVYALDLTASKPTRGSYVIDITADAYKQSLAVKVLGKVKVSSLEIGVGESDSATNLNKQTVSFPEKLSAALSADHQQKVILKTLLVDAATNKPITVHQSFVLLFNKETKEEIIFVAEQDSSKAYKFDLDVGARGADFGHRSGAYGLDLIVGDASLSNSFRWSVADIELKFNQEPVARSDKNNNTRIPRPEIIHQFRVPEKRPPRFVSDVFTALCAAPLLILFVLWAKLGVNVSNIPFSFSTIAFHLGFGSILGLFGLFWLQLNMFDTLRYLVPLALVTFIFGHRLLRTIASRKTDQK